MIIALSVLALPLPFAQDPAPTDSTAPKSPPSAEALREQINGMRRTVLMGGDSVRNSEKEALQFLQRKVAGIDKRMDFIQADLVEKEISYDLALSRAGEASSTGAQNAALMEASVLKKELQELETERSKLTVRRESMIAEQARIDERRRERESLAAKMDTQESGSEFTPFLSGGVGLAPELPTPTNPLMSDPELREDFLRRFPVRGRQLLFEADPDEYWRRWPLTPPADLIAIYLPFPAPDLPGRR